MSGNQRNSRRKEMWVSHNRVLVGGNKKNVRNPNFDTEETKLLISLWGNPSIQKTLITSHKKFPIITKLSEAMRQYGYQRTPEEINTRLKNLKCLYNRLKKDVECGIRSHPTWKHFGAMDAILTRPIFGYQSNGENQDENSLQDDDPGAVLLKEEEEGELDEEDGLRPEDLLQVETTPSELVLQEDDDDVVIKEEPIDVDEYEKRQESNKSQANNTSETKNWNIEKLPRLIPRSSWLNTNGGPREQVPPPLRSSQKVTRQSSVICVNSPRTLSTVTSTTSSMNSSNAQAKGKISLVPTNLLLNQQQQAAAAAGKNFFVSKSNLPTITTTSVSQSMSMSPGEHNSTMPMKVLLVNTMPTNSHALSQGCGTNTTITPTSNKAEIIPIPMDQARQAHFMAAASAAAPTGTNKSIPCHHHHHQQPVTSADPRIQRRSRTLKRRGPGPAARQTLSVPGMKSLISNLIQTQQETNALNRKRLELDAQQFNYQRRVIDDFLGLIPILKGIGTQFLLSASNSCSTQQQQQQQQQQAQQPSSTLHCNGHEETMTIEGVVVDAEEEESDT